MFFNQSLDNLYTPKPTLLTNNKYVEQRTN
jgi:hypothetical protein